MPLAEAHRQTEIITELRAARVRWRDALDPLSEYLATRDAVVADSLRAHYRRGQADLQDQELQYALGRDQGDDLDVGLGA